MNKKNILIMVLVLLISFFSVSFGNTAEVIFKQSHTGPASKTEGRAAEWMAKYIAEKSNGRIQMDIYHHGILCGGSGSVNIEMGISGAIEMIIDSNINLVPWVPKYQVILFPFIFKGFDETYKLIKSPFAQELSSWAEGTGLTVLGWWSRPFRQLTNNLRPVKTPEDLKGMRVRVPGTPIMLDTFKAFGADPTALATGEIYSALQLKTIHAQENGLTSIKSNRFYEVCDYLTYWSYIGDLLFVGVNSNWWNSLKIEDRNIIQEAVDKTQDYVYYVDADSESLLLEELKTEIDIYVPTEDELELFKQATKPVWETYTPVVGEDNVEKILDILSK